MNDEEKKDPNRKDPPNPEKKRSGRSHKGKIELPEKDTVNFEFTQGEDIFIVVHFAGPETTRHNLMISGLNPWQMALVAADLDERAKLGLRANIVQGAQRPKGGVARVRGSGEPPVH